MGSILSNYDQGANFPPNTPVHVTDKMTHVASTQAYNGTLSTSGSGPQTDGFGYLPDAIDDKSVCSISTGQIAPGYPFGFEGIYSGLGGQIIGGPTAQNCVYAVVQNTSIRATGVLCTGPAMETLAIGATFVLNWRGNIMRSPVDNLPPKNCLYVNYFMGNLLPSASGPHFQAESCHTTQSATESVPQAR